MRNERRASLTSRKQRPRIQDGSRTANVQCVTILRLARLHKAPQSRGHHTTVGGRDVSTGVYTRATCLHEEVLDHRNQCTSVQTSQDGSAVLPRESAQETRTGREGRLLLPETGPLAGSLFARESTAPPEPCNHPALGGAGRPVETLDRQPVVCVGRFHRSTLDPRPGLGLFRG